MAAVKKSIRGTVRLKKMGLLIVDGFKNFGLLTNMRHRSSLHNSVGTSIEEQPKFFPGADAKKVHADLSIRVRAYLASIASADPCCAPARSANCQTGHPDSHEV
jgi:hypothetical protein